jgi:hypothetical protein
MMVGTQDEMVMVESTGAAGDVATPDLTADEAGTTGAVVALLVAYEGVKLVAGTTGAVLLACALLEVTTTG